MGEHVSPYVEFNRAWIVKDLLAKFFRAINLNQEVYNQFHHNGNDNYKQLAALAEVLWEIREQLYLIYKRPLNPKGEEYEHVQKYTPSADVLQFMNIIALLFHKVLITRELRYSLEFDDSPDSNLQQMLSEYLDRMKDLFQQAEKCVIPFIAHHSADAVVLCYLLENERYVQSTLDKDIIHILSELDIPGGIEEAYNNVIRFCMRNGWDDRGKKIVNDAQKKWPENKIFESLQNPVK